MMMRYHPKNFRQMARILIIVAMLRRSTGNPPTRTGECWIITSTRWGSWVIYTLTHARWKIIKSDVNIGFRSFKRPRHKWEKSMSRWSRWGTWGRVRIVITIRRIPANCLRERHSVTKWRRNIWVPLIMYPTKSLAGIMIWKGLMNSKRMRRI